MTRRNKTPEKIRVGLHVRAAREYFGYSRKTWGRMIGFTGNYPKNNVYDIETGNKAMCIEKQALIESWTRNGLPPNSPEPDLHVAKQKHLENEALHYLGNQMEFN